MHTQFSLGIRQVALTALIFPLLFGCGKEPTPEKLNSKPDPMANSKTTTPSKPSPKPESKPLGEGLYAEMNTTKGVIRLKLEFEKTPQTVANFVGLAEGTKFYSTDGSEPKDQAGRPFYDGLTFHRVIADFMIQGGCPDGMGTGGPGYKFDDEIDETLQHDGPGIFSMANAGPGTNGSQFFITHGPTPHLNGKHTVFGHVISGHDVVNIIEKDDEMQTVKIIRKGAGAEEFSGSE